MPRKYKKRDKKAEFEARPRKPSSDWEERKLRIRAMYGVKYPERTQIPSETTGYLKLSDLFSNKEPYTITTPVSNDYSATEP